MHRVDTSNRLNGQFTGLGLREVRRISGPDPLPVLRALHGEPRGFWGRGDRWVVWGGAQVRIEIPRGDGSDRFSRVRREALRTVQPPAGDWRAVPVADRPRFFGGFSFIEAPSAERGAGDRWPRHPAAAFVLPRVLLESRDGEARLLAGAADPDTEDFLERVERALDGSSTGSSDVASSQAAPGQHPHPFERSVPDGRERWERGVRSVLEAVEHGEVRKAVVARILEAAFEGGVDPVESLRFLRSENPNAHVYSFELRPGEVFLGAAPEILAELRERRFRATAVAGSVPRGANPAADRSLARQLLRSRKDRDEHRLTAEEMAEVLQSRLTGMEVEQEPRVLTLARIQHLETEIRGVAPPDQDILSLVEALHPTPAVCGRPRAAALALIQAAESFDRGWYSGPVGWFDPAGDGDFVPALRAAAGGGTRWRLFAGAGIVAGSKPSAEWDETALKFEPALRALRAGSGGDPEGYGNEG